MEKLPEFMMNHPLLFAALAAVITYILVTELRRRSGTKALTAAQVVQLINNEDAIVIDLREAADYKNGHIINARNIPFAKLAEDAGRAIADKAAPVILYCKSGTHSPAAGKQLQAAGYERVFYLKNGVYGWLDDNLPMEKA